MKVPRLARLFLRILAALAVLAVFIALDWYPTVKELGRLRSERGDLERKIREYSSMASSFVFPDKEEEEHFRRSAYALSRELPQVENDADWLHWLLVWLRWQGEKDKLAGAWLLFSAAPGGNMEPRVRLTDREPEADWLAAQLQEIQKELLAVSHGSFPWEGLFFNPTISLSEALAVRPLAITIAAPLPSLLNFINHVSWGEFRLEIVRLRLEPGAALSRAWLICRGSSLVRKPSSWVMKIEPGDGNEGLLVDPDSPLLWQPVDSEAMNQARKKELSPLRETRILTHK